MPRRVEPPLALFAALFAGACGKPTVAAAEDAPEAIHFVDVAEEAGVFVTNVSGNPLRWYIPESNGCGAAWLDYDGDGDLDLFIANGSGLVYHDDGRRLEVTDDGVSRLYRNEGGLSFMDVTDEAGCERTEWINSVATGDVDNDGDIDLYLACFGPDVFLRNENGHFVDATEESGLGWAGWGASAAFGDVDKDGALDLYVANYCEFDPDTPPLEGRRNVVEGGIEIAWGPEEENKQGANVGAPDVFYLGDGKGGFREATSELGLGLDKALCSYAVVFSDVDSDGWQDILVANDLQPCNLFMNQGGEKFSEEGRERGFAFDADGKATGAMGLTVEDFDGDGDYDVYRTNFDFETNGLHVNDGTGHFREQAAHYGLAEPTRDRLGWGAGWFDADLDGDLDLLVANGHVYPQGEDIGMGPWFQLSQLFEAQPDAERGVVYQDATTRSGPALAVARSARGVAFGDPDEDGDVDFVIIDIDAPPRLVRNDSKHRGHWLGVKLIGTASNRDGMGARVVVHAGGTSWSREMRTTQGLYSSHDPRLHFGLGPVEAIERVEVHWPSGRRSTVRDAHLDSLVTITEPDAIER